MTEGAPRFLLQTILLDLEVRPDGAGPIEIGCVVGDREWRKRLLNGKVGATLDAFLRDTKATGILGHNVLHHDLDVLRERAPGCAALGLPVVDTLFLSPLAFPENPYHHLVKGYKLSKSAVNDPVADARQAGRVFVDCWDSLLAADHRIPGLLGFLRYVFSLASSSGAIEDRGGMEQAFEAMGAPRMDFDPAAEVFRRIAHTRACECSVEEAVEHLRPTGDGRRALALAYLAAWLPVAGDRSVIPHWVRREIPEVGALTAELRDQPVDCGTCGYCREHHDPRRQLQRYFGFDDFRPRPVAADGGSLQARIVAHGMRGGSYLAILPTGGGKSLCFQLPALARNFRTGSLTVVISPLQALMRDQVENLNARTNTRAAALYGLLTPLERAQVLRDVGAGDVTLLYVAPEQLRNRSFRKAVNMREIGAWVFDEAHCLSKWGHDFRPDYLYAGRAVLEIAKEQGTKVPMIAALTATARIDVAIEIREYFREQLNVELAVFEGGVQRDNLTYRVEKVSGAEKRERVRGLCSDQLHDPGSVIVYLATRSGTEAMAGLLERDGLPVAHFHGGMQAPDKKSVMERFLGGEVRVICATNAFGMGVDKPDVRLVVHAEIPGTLENYLQESGRAGRDQEPACCVLLFDEGDVENQFQLAKASEVSYRDLVQMLRGLRVIGNRGGREYGDEFHVTSGELLRDEEVDTSFEATDRSADTKVRIGVSWLERAGMLERNLNHTRVFTGKPAVATLTEAEARMTRLGVQGLRRAMWTQIFRALLDTGPDDVVTVDSLAGLPAFEQWARSGRETDRPGERVSREVFDQLHAMAEGGLLESGVLLTAFVHSGGSRSSRKILAKVGAVEETALELMAEHAPDIEDGQWGRLSLRQLNEELRRAGVESNPDTLRTVIGSLAGAGKALGEGVRLASRVLDRDRLSIRVQGSMQALREGAQLRRAVAEVCLGAMLDKIRAHETQRTNLLVEFSIEDMVQAVHRDLVLRSKIGSVAPEAIERVLLFLHDHGCIILQSGLAVFRSAMTIRLDPGAKGRRYTKESYAQLKAHYDERTVQIHVMQRYAKLGVEGNGAVREFVNDYFDLDRDEFLTRHFRDRKSEIRRPISSEAYRNIVDDLDHAVQQRIVTAPPDQNQLVLAGPGSGKTRVIVHRCAYLIRVLRVPRSSILILCFNRSTVLELRRRLKALIGDRLGGLQVHTYDSLALRIAGRSLIGLHQESTESAEDIFAEVREQAAQLLEGEQSMVGLEADELRDRLLSGYRHILVDEYQDIDESQYRLVSAIAGRTLADKDARLAITAVGDDDQNIYSWRGSSVEFIRRFEEDYQAQRHELVENYRSTQRIIDAANRWIEENPDRSKTQAIRLDRHRASDPDAVGDPVRLVRVPGSAEQVEYVVQLLREIIDRDGADALDEVAVLGRQWDFLMPLRLRCRELGIPIRWAREKDVRPWQVREVCELLDWLRDEAEVDQERMRAKVAGIVSEYGDSNWTDYLDQLVSMWVEDAAGSAALPARSAAEFLWMTMREDRQLATASHGAFFGTVHQAKGLEFDRVCLLDGGWELRRGETKADLVRLFYVGMTRARTRLDVLSFADRARSFRSTVLAPGVETVDLVNGAVRELAARADRRVEQLSLEHMDLGYASQFAVGHEIHAALRAVRVGSRLELQTLRGKPLLVDARSGHPVGAISQKGRSALADRRVLEITVLAVIRRRKEQSEPDYRDRARIDSWELPVVEIVWEPRAGSQTSGDS